MLYKLLLLKGKLFLALNIITLLINFIMKSRGSVPDFTESVLVGIDRL
jgi:hypothetical protein